MDRREPEITGPHASGRSRKPEGTAGPCAALGIQCAAGALCSAGDTGRGRAMCGAGDTGRGRAVCSAGDTGRVSQALDTSEPSFSPKPPG